MAAKKQKPGPKPKKKRKLRGAKHQVEPREDWSHLPPKVSEALKPLSHQERRFVMEYCGRSRGNQGLAAKRAGYGTTYAGHAGHGSLLMTHPRIRQAIDAWSVAFALTAAQITMGFADLAEANLGPFLKYDKKAKAMKVALTNDEVWENYKHWVKAVKVDPETGQVVELVLHDSAAARRDLAKISKLYSDAPILQSFLFLQNMSDEELLARYRALEGTGDEGTTQAALPPGMPVQVVQAPEAVGVDDQDSEES